MKKTKHETSPSTYPGDDKSWSYSSAYCERRRDEEERNSMEATLRTLYYDCKSGYEGAAMNINNYY